MADDDENPHQFSGGPGIGQTSDGKIASFPLSELGKKTQERDTAETAEAYAVEQAEAGFPEPEDDDDDLSDLDEMEEIADAVAK